MGTVDLSWKGYSAIVRDMKSLRHNYSNVNPRLLVLAGIIPDDWNVDSFLPPHGSSRHGVIYYENGFFVSGDHDSWLVSHRADFELGVRPESVHFITKYVELLAPDTFDKAEMVWEFRFERGDSAEWIAGRFFRTGIIPGEWEKSQAIPSFGFRLGGTGYFYRFAVDDEGEFAVVNCQAHSGVPLDDAEILEWFSNYDNHEEVMLRNLIQLIED